MASLWTCTPPSAVLAQLKPGTLIGSPIVPLSGAVSTGTDADVLRLDAVRLQLHGRVADSAHRREEGDEGDDQRGRWPEAPQATGFEVLGSHLELLGSICKPKDGGQPYLFRGPWNRSVARVSSSVEQHGS